MSCFYGKKAQADNLKDANNSIARKKRHEGRIPVKYKQQRLTG